MKKLLIIPLLMFAIMYESIHASDNSFDLASRSLEVAITLTSEYEKESLLSLLRTPAHERPAIPAALDSLVSENIGWTYIKKLGLEQSKKNILAMENMPNKNIAIVEHARRLYLSQFNERLSAISREIEDQWQLQAQQETISMVTSFVEATTATDFCALIHVNDSAKNAVVSSILNQYDQEGCGICGKKGADVFWFSPKSRGAHSVCADLLKPVEQDITQRMYQAFDRFRSEEGYALDNRAHVKMIGQVQEQCGDLTVLEYLTVHGQSKLKSLFDNAASMAVYLTLQEHRESQLGW